MRRGLTLAILGLLMLALQQMSWGIVPGPVFPPPPGGGHPSEPVTPPSPEIPTDPTVGTILNQPNDPEEDVTFSDKVVTASFSGFFYIEEDNRSSGIRVEISASVQPGDRVTVTGHLDTTEDGERYLDAESCTPGTPTQGEVPAPLAMDNLTVGGTSLNDYTPGINYQNECPWHEFGGGCYNLGLLVRTWGCVTQTEADWFELDDGTGLYRPIRVKTNGVPNPNIGQFVIVTGISSCFSWPSGGNTYKRPLIRIRNADDIETVASGTTLTAWAIAEPPEGYDYAWNLIGIPAVPFGLYPHVVFSNTLNALEDQTLTGNLWRWRTTAPQHFDDSYCAYNPATEESNKFRTVYSGEAYWIISVLAGVISYQAVLGSADTTDRFIRLPYGIDTEGNGGFTLVGHPFRNTQLLEKLSVTDGCHVLTMQDAIDKHWIDSSAWWWSSSGNTLQTTCITGDDTRLRPWRGYWIRSFRDKLALIIPAGADNLVLTATGEDDRISLRWTKSSMASITGYKIYRAESSGGYSSQPLDTVDDETFTYVDNGELTCGTNYYYIVKPTDGSTDGTASNEASASVSVGNLKFYPSDDEAVFTGRPDTPYGHQDLGNKYMGGLFVGGAPQPKDSPSGSARSYLKFNLSALGTNAVIDSAELYMYCNRISSGQNPCVAIFRLSSQSYNPDPADEWEEDTITHAMAINSQTGIDQYKGLNPEGTSVLINNKEWNSWDVKDAVQAECAKGSPIVLTLEAEEYSGSGWIYFIEKDFNLPKQPYLRITYHEAP